MYDGLKIYRNTYFNWFPTHFSYYTRKFWKICSKIMCFASHLETLLESELSLPQFVRPVLDATTHIKLLHMPEQLNMLWLWDGHVSTKIQYGTYLHCFEPQLNARWSLQVTANTRMKKRLFQKAFKQNIMHWMCALTCQALAG
jgi:hypothetical protein